MSLYLKYRPQDFATMVGQKHATRTLQNALKNHSLAHAYLFCGPRGTGKTSLARIVAKAINCTDLSKSSEPCNKCNICLAIQEGRMVDLIEIDAASNRGIDEIRELREKINFSPSQAKSKVYIIDEVHMLTKEAFNALLKTLEEPPEHAYFILATTEAHKIPETIISRCQQFTFKRIELDSITNRLAKIAEEEKVESEEGALRLIAKASNGGLRDAIGLFEQLATEGQLNEKYAADHLGLTGNAFIEDFFGALVDQKPLKAMEIIDQVNAEGKNLNQFAIEVIGFLREQMLIQIHDSKACQQMMEWIEVFNEARLKLSQASIPQLPLEMAVIRMCGFESKDEGENKTKTIERVATSNNLDHSPQKNDVKNKEKDSEKMEKKEEKSLNPPSIHAREIPKSRPAQLENVIDDLGGDEAEQISPLHSVPVEMKDSSALSKPKENQKIKQTSLTFETIQQNWPRVLEHIQTPFIKMSLMDGRLMDYENETVCLEFNSTTLMEKVQSSKSHAEVIVAMEEVFKAKLDLKMEVKKIQLTPHPDNQIAPKKPEEKKDSMVNMAEEVFGVNGD